MIDISVILPVFNGGKYLFDAIKSILTQSFKNFELIVINDGSTDESYQIAKGFEEADSRVKIISRENKGLVKSLNEGINHSVGKYIVRMDADDIALPNRLQILYEYMEKNLDVSVCGSSVLVFGDNIKDYIWRLQADNEEIKSKLLFSTTLVHPSVIIRSSFIKENNIFYNDKYKNIEDYKMWVDISEVGLIHNIGDVLLKYRYHDQSVTRIADQEEFGQRYELTKNIFTLLLIKIGLSNNEEENKIHYVLGDNTRILNNDINFDFVFSYGVKLILANRDSLFFVSSMLKRSLSKRIFSAFYLKLKYRDYFVLKYLFKKEFFKFIFTLIFK